MKYKIERVRLISRQYVQANRDKLFLFGDNLEGRGFGGQARALRGEPNAIGIPTKKSPSYRGWGFLYGSRIRAVAIDRAFAEIALRAAPGEIQVIVIPSNGLGTGRAQLQARAPRTFAYLQSRLAELADSL